MNLEALIFKTVLWGVFLIFFYYTIFWFLGLFEEEKNRIANTEKSPGVTVIIPIFNEENTVEGTVKSVFDLEYPKEKLKVICVNDGSADNSLNKLNELAKIYPITILNQKNQGKYMCLNNALKITTTKYFACLDADSFVTKDSLNYLIEEFNSDNIAASMPIMKILKPTNWIEKIQHLEYMASIFLKKLMESRDCIHVAPGPFTIYRTEIIRKLGGFRKAHFTEDMEIALRLQSEQYQLRQSLNAIIYTKAPDSLKKYYKQRIRWYRGTFLNFLDYRKLLFKKEYGDFGIIQIPVIGLGGLLTLTAVAMLMYKKIQSVVHFFKKLYIFNFDLATFFKTLEFSYNPWEADYFILFTTFCLILLSIMIIYISLKFNKEKAYKGIYTSSLIYLFAYSLITAYIWLCAINQIAFKKHADWSR